MPYPDLLNANPGDVVVPLSDMLDLLSSALNDAELQDLSAQLIARRTTMVQSGDVISAGLMNQILSDVANLQARIADLENGIPSQSAPTIVLVDPNDGVQIGEELQVVGTNLSLDTLTSVLIANRQINAFGAASDNKLLVFDVPAIPGIPAEGGADVNLVLTNEFGSDSILVRVLQSETPDLAANVEIFIVEFPNGEILPGSTNDFRFRLVASANLTEQYTVTAAIDGDAGWSHAFEVGGTSQTITINQTQTTNTEIFFDAQVIAGSSGIASVWLNVESVNFPNSVDVDSPIVELVLNEEPVGDRDLTFIEPLVGIESPEVFQENPDTISRNLLIRASGLIRFDVRVLMNEAGQCTLSEAVIVNNPGSAYTLILLSGNATSAAIGAGGIASFTYQLNISGSPTSLGSLAEIQLTATHSVSGEIVEFIQSIELVLA